MLKKIFFLSRVTIIKSKIRFVMLMSLLTTCRHVVSKNGNDMPARRYENIYQHDRASLHNFLHTFEHVYKDFYIVARERRYENIYQHDRASLPIFLHTFEHVYKDFYIVARERRYENIY